MTLNTVFLEGKLFFWQFFGKNRFPSVFRKNKSALSPFSIKPFFWSQNEKTPCFPRFFEKTFSRKHANEKNKNKRESFLKSFFIIADYKAKVTTPQVVSKWLGL
jgi:hypothetical protein